MPCDGSHCEAFGSEIALSRVMCCLDELNGKKFSKSDWSGYHDKAYGHASDELLDQKTAELCARLESIGESFIRNMSLELQIWWRDHQEHDRRRLKREKEEAEKKAVRKAALAKLTAEEREALGLR